MCERSEQDNIEVRVLPVEVGAFPGAGHAVLYERGRVSAGHRAAGLGSRTRVHSCRSTTLEVSDPYGLVARQVIGPASFARARAQYRPSTLRSG
ncbi:hypothetical protein [Streptomyces poriticola]|uniref:hypothetical protein n=1 Tax=Streptomyces poriticola TaxID=3120506 RepID=UPI002FCE31EB